MFDFAKMLGVASSNEENEDSKTDKTKKSAREALYKSERKKGSRLDRKVRATDLGKMRKAKRVDGANGGRNLEPHLEQQSSSSSDEDSASATLPQKPKSNLTHAEKQQSRLAMLEEYRRKKAAAKKDEEVQKKKRPPFKAGVVHHSWAPFKSENANWTMTTSKMGGSSKSKVFVFSGNSSQARQPVKNKLVDLCNKRETRGAANERRRQEAESRSEAEAKTPGLPIEKDVERPEKETVAPGQLEDGSGGAVLADRKETAESAEDQGTSGDKYRDQVGSPEEAEEARDVVPDNLVFRTPRPRTPQSRIMARSPRVLCKVSPPTPIDNLKNSVCFERGSSSDRRRRREGKPPARPMAEILGIDDLFGDDQITASPTTEMLQSREKTPKMDGKKLDFESQIEMEDQPKDVAHFRKLLATETARLTAMCEDWEAKLDKLPDHVKRDEDLTGNMRLTVGQARLVMNPKGRFVQFSSLIDNCEFGYGEKETTCMDLQGFWDMIYYQVENVDKKFAELASLEANNWRKGVESRKRPAAAKNKNSSSSALPAKKSKPPKAKASRSLKEMLAAKRREMMSQKAKQEALVVAAPTTVAVAGQSPARTVTPAPDEQAAVAEEAKNVVFDGGFFVVKTPTKSPASVAALAEKEAARKSTSANSTPLKSMTSNRSGGNSLRVSVLSKRISSSAGVSSGSLTPFVVMKATESIRKSLRREPSPVVKAQLDYDLDEEGDTKENRPSNTNTHVISPFVKSKEKESMLRVPSNEDLVCFDSPGGANKTPRRSARLSSAKKIDYKC